MGARVLRNGGLLSMLAFISMSSMPAASPHPNAAASAAPDPKPAVITIKAVEQPDGTRELIFDAPGEVQTGAKLTVRRSRSTAGFGPASFTLYRRSPAEGPNSLFRTIALWHGTYDPDTGELEHNPVDVRKPGWDREGNKKRKGDSWIALEPDPEGVTMRVSAKPDTTLHFLNYRQQHMHGSIKVVPAE